MLKKFSIYFQKPFQMFRKMFPVILEFFMGSLDFNLRIGIATFNETVKMFLLQDKDNNNNFSS